MRRAWVRRRLAPASYADSPAGPEKDGFSFDRVFDTDTKQEDIFDFGVKTIVEDVMTGFNGTLFCYGQTGSGKTYSELARVLFQLTPSDDG